MKNIKIFVLGLPKTGTNSISAAVDSMGFEVAGYGKNVYHTKLSRFLLKFNISLSHIPWYFTEKDFQNKKKLLKKAIRHTKHFDCFQDMPWPMFYKELENVYPDAKFILTSRNVDSWIKSQINHFGNHYNHLNYHFYSEGAPVGNESLYMDKFESHNQAVINHFKDSRNFLHLKLEDTNKLETLENFLQKTSSLDSYPIKNVTSK